MSAKNIEGVQDRKEYQIAMQEKMFYLGRLAANIAHEINNPLEAILNRIGCLLMQDFRDGGVERLRKELILIQEQVYQISSTTNALLAFGKESSERFRPVDINTVVEKSVELCRLYQLKSGIRINLNLANNLPKVMGSEIGLEQCIVNIINNSLESIKNEETIEVETCLNSLSKEVMITISDRGEGIPKENLDRIFEPFFSTKDTLHGAGMGLAICYGIVADHGGIIDVQSKVGQGTTMTISIPIINEKKEVE